MELYPILKPSIQIQNLSITFIDRGVYVETLYYIFLFTFWHDLHTCCRDYVDSTR